MRLVCCVLCLYSVLVLASCGDQTGSAAKSFESLSGPYFGLELPRDTPEMILPGLISTNELEACSGFLNGGKVYVFFNAFYGTQYTYLLNGHWTEPQPAPWQNENKTQTDFTIGPDDETIYFQSSMLTHESDKKRESNIWRVKWTGEGWSRPELMPDPICSPEFGEGYPSCDKHGNLLFFTGSRPESKLGDIFLSGFTDGGNLEPTRLPFPVNTRYHEVDPIIAPDGSYMLFASGRPGGYTFGDLYVSFKNDDGGWGHPTSVDRALNELILPVRETISADGKILIFTAQQDTDTANGEPAKSELTKRFGNTDIFWVSTEFVSRLKERCADRQCGFDVFKGTYENEGIDGALAALANLELTTHRIEISEFMMFAGELLEDGHIDEVNRLLEVLIEKTGEEKRVRQAEAAIHTMHGDIAVGISKIENLITEDTNPVQDQTFGIVSYYISQNLSGDAYLQICKLAAKQNPDSYIDQITLAQVYEKRGDDENAVEYVNRALALHPDIREATELLEKLTKDEDDEANYKGDYLGQKPPGITPEKFALELMQYASSTSFSNDGKEFYFTRYRPNSPLNIKFVQMKDGKWSKPAVASFSSNKHHDADMAFSPDGETVFFRSYRPLPGETEEPERWMLWYAKRNDSEWPEAKPVLFEGIGAIRGGYPAATDDGTLFFSTRQADTIGPTDIYYAIPTSTGFSRPINLGRMANSDYGEGDLYVAPDQSYLIVSCFDHPDISGDSDLFISVKKADGTWSKQANIGVPINTKYGENCPYVSYDGKYLFFNRYDAEQEDNPEAGTFWVDIGILDKYLKQR